VWRAGGESNGFVRCVDGGLLGGGAIGVRYGGDVLIASAVAPQRAVALACRQAGCDIEVTKDSAVFGFIQRRPHARQDCLAAQLVKPTPKAVLPTDGVKGGREKFLML